MFCKVKRSIKEYREWQMKIYTRVEDSLEQRLAGVIAAKQKLAEQIERDKENTTLARFIRNLESRIYAQLSRQLVENLFG